MRNFHIRRAQLYKNYVFLLSVFEGNAYWSAHEYHGDARAPLGVMADLFQTAHNKQVEFLIKQAAENEPAEFKEVTVDDQTLIVPGMSKLKKK